MDPTSLPTDNLYKFWALGSMLVLMLTAYSAGKGHLALLQQKEKLNTRIAKHSKTKEWIVRDMDALELEGKQMSKEFKKVVQRQVLNKIELDKLKDSFETLKWIQEVRLGASAAVFLVFFVLATLGFSTWYKKSQKYQDEVAELTVREQRAKTELAELELAKAKKLATASSAPAPTPHSTASSLEGTRPPSSPAPASPPPPSATPSGGSKYQALPSEPSPEP